MTDTTRSRRGGAPSPSSTLVQADQVTIVGDGSYAKPLRAGEEVARGGILVEDEGAPVGPSAARVLNFVGPGVSARDRRDGESVDVFVPGGIFLSQNGEVVPGGPHGVVDFVGDVRVEDAGNGGARVEVARPAAAAAAAVLSWSAIDVVRAPATRYFFAPGFAGQTSADRPIPFVVPFSGALHRLFVVHAAGDGDGESISYTVMVNGAPTELSVAVVTGAPGRLGKNTDARVDVEEGDLVVLFAEKTVTIGTNLMDASASLVLTPAA